MTILEDREGCKTKITLPEAFKPFENQKVWLCSDPKGKPISPIDGKSTGYSSPNKWGDFEAARRFVENNPDHTPAIVVSPGSELICIDLDEVIDEKGSLAQWAREIVQEMGSYTEVSTSGKGLHIFAYGTKLGKGVKTTYKGKSVEIYGSSDKPKPIKVTFDIFEGKEDLKRPQEAIDRFYQKFFPKKEERAREWTKSPDMTDEAVMDLLRKYKHAEKFKVLFDAGDLSNHEGDHSAADMALVSMISFFTQNEAQIARIFTKSKLVRKKSTESERKDYLPRTIKKALDDLENTYQHRGSQNSGVPLSGFDEGLIPEQEFPVEVLPKVLRDVTKAIATTSDSDCVMAATASQSLCAIALRKTVQVIEKTEPDLKHYLCFFHTIVGASAQSRKSSNTKPLLNIFETYHEEAKAQYQEEMRAYQNAQTLIKKQKEDIFKSPASMREKVTEIAKLELEVEKLKPTYYRLFATDVTGPAFIKRLGETEGCYSLFSTDAGDIIDFIIGNNQTGTNDMIFVKLITNDHIHVDRVGPDRRGVEIDVPDPCGNVFLMTQEERWVRFNTHTRLLGSGLLGRNNPAVISPRDRGYIEEEKDEKSKTEEIEKWNQMIKALLSFGGKKKFVLSGEAKIARRELNNEWQSTVGVRQENYDVGDIIHRFISECVKRAALFHVVDHWDNLANAPEEIPLLTFKRAVAAQKYYLNQAINSRRGVVSKLEAIEYESFLEKWIEKAEKEKEYLEFLPPRTIYRLLRRKPEKAAGFLKEMEEIGVVQTMDPEGIARKPRYRLDMKRAKAFLKSE